MPARRFNPVSALAVVLVVGGIVAMLRQRTPRPPLDPCEGGADAACGAPAASGARGAPAFPTPAPTNRPVLSAGTACRNVAYLCADLGNADRIRIQRWRGFSGTLVVRVPRPDLADAGVAQSLQRAASAGVRLWNGQPFPILVDERGTRPAHVEVRWVSSLGGARIGLARTEWNPAAGLRVLSLELVTRSPYGSGTVDPRQLRLTAAHEMGHALGLPHSDNPRDVMYPTNSATALSARDYRTLEALYDLEDGTEIVR